MTNIYREAQQLLRWKHPMEMNKEEQKTVSAARIPLISLARYNDMTTEEGLEALARIVEENEDAGADQNPGAIKGGCHSRRSRLNNYSTDITRLTSRN